MASSAELPDAPREFLVEDHIKRNRRSSRATAQIQEGVVRDRLLRFGISYSYVGASTDGKRVLSALTLTLVGLYIAIDVLFFARQSGGWLTMAAGLPIGLRIVGFARTASRRHWNRKSRPGGHRTALSATAGSGPVPSLHFGEAGECNPQRPLIKR
jgi:hypothetical protein